MFAILLCYYFFDDLNTPKAESVMMNEIASVCDSCVRNFDMCSLITKGEEREFR